MKGNSEKLELAQFALFSLYYATRKILADQSEAEKFYTTFMSKSDLAPKVDHLGVKEIIEFARLGEKELENRIKQLQGL